MHNSRKLYSDRPSSKKRQVSVYFFITFITSTAVPPLSEVPHFIGQLLLLEPPFVPVPATPVPISVTHHVL